MKNNLIIAFIIICAGCTSEFKTGIMENETNSTVVKNYTVIHDCTPPHIYTNGLSLFLLTGSDIYSNAVYFYDAHRGVSDTNENEVWFRFTNGGKIYTEYFPNWKIYNPKK